MKVSFNGKPIEIKRTSVYPAPYLEVGSVGFVNIPMEEKAELILIYDEAPESVVIRPLNLKQNYDLNGNTLTIPLERPCNLSIEANGEAKNAFLVSAGAVESIDRAQYENVICFEKGEHFADIIALSDNTLVYFEEGAYVHGKIYAENCRHIAVAGYGIITMENFERSNSRSLSIDFRFCQDVVIQNIVVTDSCGWSCRIWGCDDVHINNFKAIGCRGNSDGIDICGSKNVLVENCFTRVFFTSVKCSKYK